ECDFPLEHWREVDLLNPREVTFSNCVNYFNEQTPNSRKRLLRGLSILSSPRILLSVDTTAARLFDLSVRSIIDAKLERRTTPYTSEVLKARFDPIDKRVVFIGVRVLLERHLFNALRRPGRDELGPQLLAVGHVHRATLAGHFEE